MGTRSLFRPKWVLLLGAAALIGCGDSDNSATGPGPNRSVDDNNIPMVLNMVFSNLGQTLVLGPGTHKGSVSGEVVVTMANAKTTQDLVLDDLGDLQFEMPTGSAYTLAYKEFSNGSLYYDGTVNYRFAPSQMEEFEDFDFFISTDNLQISGDYKAKIKMLVELIGGEPSSESFYEVDGKKFSPGDEGFNVDL